MNNIKIITGTFLLAATFLGTASAFADVTCFKKIEGPCATYNPDGSPSIGSEARERQEREPQFTALEAHLDAFEEVIDTDTELTCDKLYAAREIVCGGETGISCDGYSTEEYDCRLDHK